MHSHCKSFEPQSSKPKNTVANGKTLPSTTAPTINIQAKLEVTSPDDPYEQEADAMAERVMSKRLPSRFISRAPSSHSSVSVSPSLESSIKSSRKGFPMPSDLRSKMETGFGADFSSVRFHTGPVASEMSSSIKAKAFTYWNDVYFNAGQYNPGTSDGQRLIAHELTHTLQQGSGVYRQQEETVSPSKEDEQDSYESRLYKKRNELYQSAENGEMIVDDAMQEYVNLRKVIFLPYLEKIRKLAWDFSKSRSENGFFYGGVSWWFDDTADQRRWTYDVERRMEAFLAKEFIDGKYPDNNAVLRYSFQDDSIDFSEEKFKKAETSLNQYYNAYSLKCLVNQLTVLASEIDESEGFLGTMSAFMSYISPSRRIEQAISGITGSDGPEFARMMEIQRSLAGLFNFSQEQVGDLVFAYSKNKHDPPLKNPIDLTLDDYEGYALSLINEINKYREAHNFNDPDIYWDQALIYLRSCFGEEYVNNLDDLNSDSIQAQIMTMVTKGVLGALIVALCAPMAAGAAGAGTGAGAAFEGWVAGTAVDVVANSGIEIFDQSFTEEGVDWASIADGAALSVAFDGVTGVAPSVVKGGVAAFRKFKAARSKPSPIKGEMPSATMEQVAPSATVKQATPSAKAEQATPSAKVDEVAPPAKASNARAEKKEKPLSIRKQASNARAEKKAAEASEVAANAESRKAFEKYEAADKARTGAKRTADESKLAKDAAAAREAQAIETSQKAQTMREKAEKIEQNANARADEAIDKMKAAGRAENDAKAEATRARAVKESAAARENTASEAAAKAKAEKKAAAQEKMEADKTAQKAQTMREKAEEIEQNANAQADYAKAKATRARAVMESAAAREKTSPKAQTMRKKAEEIEQNANAQADDAKAKANRARAVKESAAAREKTAKEAADKAKRKMDDAEARETAANNEALQARAEKEAAEAEETTAIEEAGKANIEFEDAHEAWDYYIEKAYRARAVEESAGARADNAKKAAAKAKSEKESAAKKEKKAIEAAATAKQERKTALDEEAAFDSAAEDAKNKKEAAAAREHKARKAINKDVGITLGLSIVPATYNVVSKDYSYGKDATVEGAAIIAGLEAEALKANTEREAAEAREATAIEKAAKAKAEKDAAAAMETKAKEDLAAARAAVKDAEKKAAARAVVKEAEEGVAHAKAEYEAAAARETAAIEAAANARAETAAAKAREAEAKKYARN